MYNIFIKCNFIDQNQSFEILKKIPIKDNENRKYDYIINLINHMFDKEEKISDKNYQKIKDIEINENQSRLKMYSILEDQNDKEEFKLQIENLDKNRISISTLSKTLLISNDLFKNINFLKKYNNEVNNKNDNYIIELNKSLIDNLKRNFCHKKAISYINLLINNRCLTNFLNSKETNDLLKINNINNDDILILISKLKNNENHNKKEIFTFLTRNYGEKKIDDFFTTLTNEKKISKILKEWIYNKYKNEIEELLVINKEYNNFIKENKNQDNLKSDCHKTNIFEKAFLKFKSIIPKEETLITKYFETLNNEQKTYEYNSEHGAIKTKKEYPIINYIDEQKFNEKDIKNFLSFLSFKMINPNDKEKILNNKIIKKIEKDAIEILDLKNENN